MNIIIPFVSTLLYWLGGQRNKWYRWLMGIPIAIIGIFTYHYWAIFAIPTYWVATSAFPYGEKSWLNFLGEYGKFFVVGLVLGSCSFILLPFGLALLQSLLSGISFLILKILDDKDIVKNPYQELLRGFFGTIIYFWR